MSGFRIVKMLLFAADLLRRNVVDIKGKKIGRVVDIQMDVEASPWAVKKLMVLSGMLMMRKKIDISIEVVDKVKDDAIVLRIEKAELKRRAKGRSAAYRLGKLVGNV